MQTIDLSGFDRLKIFDLAEHLAADNGEPLMSWLQLMARDSFEYYEEYRNDPDTFKGKLIFREPHYPVDILDKHLDPDRFYKEVGEIKSQWLGQISLLREVTKNPTSPTDPYPANSKSFPLITVTQQDFIPWFVNKFPDRQWPRFWFKDGDEEKPLPPSEELRSLQATFAPNQLKTAMKEWILPKIENAIRQDTPWHQRTLLRNFMEIHAVPEKKFNGLFVSLKNEMKRRDIKSIEGRPKKTY